MMFLRNLLWVVVILIVLLSLIPLFTMVFVIIMLCIPVIIVKAMFTKN